MSKGVMKWQRAWAKTRTGLYQARFSMHVSLGLLPISTDLLIGLFLDPEGGGDMFL
jgi:hypothetical protein